MIAPVIPGAQDLLSLLAQEAFQVAQQDGGLHVLMNRLQCPPAPVFQVQIVLERLVIGLVPPAPVVDFQELPGGILFLLQQGSHQHFQLALGQPDTDKAHGQLFGQTVFTKPAPLSGGSFDLNHQADTCPIHPEQFLGLPKGPG